MDDSKIKRLNLLTNFASSLETKNPSMARICRSKILDAMGNGAHDFNRDTPFLCNFCGNAFNSTTFSVRFSPKMSLKPKMMQRLRRAQNPWKKFKNQSKFQENLLQSYRDSSTDMLVKCLLCQKVQKFKGPSRAVLFREKFGEKKHHQEDSTPLTKKGKRKLKKKLNRKKKQDRLSEGSFESTFMSPGNASLVTMETDSGVDTSLLSVMSPLISSTPKPIQESIGNKAVDRTDNASWEFSQNMSSDSSQSKIPILSLWPQATVEDNKSTDERLSLSASLLESDSPKSVKNTVSKTGKKKKNKDMHLQLQKIFKKDQKSKESKSLLKDFLSSL